MSIALMSAVYQSDLDKNLKAIALAYADFASDDGTSIYPSIDYVAWKTGYSDRSVQRITRDLEKIGVLVLVRASSGRPGDTNEYKMIPGKLPKREPYTGDTVSPVRVTTTTRRVTTTTETGDTVSPNPLDNHQEPRERRETRKQPEKSPPHLNGFLASTSADRPYDLEAALKSIAINSNGKISTAAKDLQRMGIKPEQLVGFKKYWAENHSKMGAKPWPVQVVDLWDDYQGWSGKNAAAVNAAPDLTSLPSYRFMEATND